MSPWFSVAGDPIHVLELPAHYTYEELDAQMIHMGQEYRRFVRERPRAPCAILVDLSKIARSEARNRKRIAQMMEDLTDLMRPRVVAQAYVAHGSVIRAALTAVMWIKSSPWPVQVFGTRAEAEAWLREKIERRLTTG
ncbi:MAG: hypothetical protein IT378_07630 [Sandaracinaceae bacterium]|nr:hypothetical protein [Sandaracinaceae bacterium]